MSSLEVHHLDFRSVTLPPTTEDEAQLLTTANY
jgi:hypothetical protein